ncbi:hypothetical protein [Streptomyces sp. SHP 1-2]|nr:hypothetical protein [Streptomyces sp. SHP 1-2]MCW5254693.1 hypothetical protein [Streptomyces sp. SHP 1-2]
MKTNLLDGDLCPLCRRPLTLRPTTVVRSAGVPYPTRTDYRDLSPSGGHL